MSKVRPTILKIGGSVITDKSEELKAKTQVIDRLATEIQRAGTDCLIIVHGGGSFGHPLAQRYAIRDGLKEYSQRMGFCETHHVMTVLNGLLMDSLVWHGVPAISVSPSSVIVTKNGRIHFFEDAPIKRMLEMHFLPVMYGDATLDVDLGFTILSGDQLATTLAIKYDAERIIMGVDVDGLYDADPRVEKAANILEHLTLEQLNKLQGKLFRPTSGDVTGGMAGKIAELFPALERGIPTTIVNAAEPDSIYRALVGEKVRGTIIEKE